MRARVFIAGGVLVLATGLAAAWAVRAAIAPRAALELVPGTVSACRMPVAIGVRWDARAAGVDYVELYVNNFGQTPKLWVHDGPQGSHETGAWAHDGFTVTMKAPDGTVLARRTLTTTVCPGEPWR